MTQHWKLPEFDVLVALHQKDPVAYEQFRMQVLNDAVASAPAERQPALARTLRKIESARQAASSPLEAAIAAHLLMCESVAGLNLAMHRLQHISAEMQAAILIETVQQNSRQ